MCALRNARLGAAAALKERTGGFNFPAGDTVRRKPDVASRRYPPGSAPERQFHGHTDVLV